MIIEKGQVIIPIDELIESLNNVLSTRSDVRIERRGTVIHIKSKSSSLDDWRNLGVYCISNTECVTSIYQFIDIISKKISRKVKNKAKITVDDNKIKVVFSA